MSGLEGVSGWWGLLSPPVKKKALVDLLLSARLRARRWVEVKLRGAHIDLVLDLHCL